MELPAVLARFTNLKHFSVIADGELLAEFHSLKKLRSLHIRMNLVHLPDLDALSIRNWQERCMNLKKSTYLRNSDMVRGRNKKLSIYDYDFLSNFAGTGQPEFVQFIALCAAIRFRINFLFRFVQSVLSLFDRNCCQKINKNK